MIHMTGTPSTSTSNIMHPRGLKTRTRNDSSYFELLISKAKINQKLPENLEFKAHEKIKYKFSGELGKGTYGVVYKGVSSEGEPVAIKVLRINEDEGLSETCIREIVLLQELNSGGSHPNILNFHDMIICYPCIYLTTELMHMDLRTWMKSSSFRHRLIHLRRIAQCVLNGLLHCHRRGVMHRDLKPHNILISQDLRQIKIADFGLARYFHDLRKTLTHEVVTLWYRSPEVLLGDCQYDQSIDIWSLGCILAEVWTGRPLFTGDSEIDTLFKIFILLGTPSKAEWPKHAFEQYSAFPKFKGKKLESIITLPDGWRKDCPLSEDDRVCFVSFLHLMLQVDPSKRADVLTCLHHPFLNV